MQHMAFAVIVGVLVGLLAFLPMYAGLRVSKRMDASTSAASYLTPVLLAIGGSFVVLVFATAICVIAARAVLVFFALAEAGTLIAAALGYGIARALRK